MPSPASASAASGGSATHGSATPFNPHSLYSSNNALASSSSSTSAPALASSPTNHATPSKPAGAAASSDTPSSSSSKKKPAKRRKVNLACIYCRRSHMTCDEGRPCQRCIKRDIGHLCHDESTSKPAPSASQASTHTSASAPGAPRTSASSEPSALPVPEIATTLVDGPPGVSAIDNGAPLGGSGSSYFGAAAGLNLDPSAAAPPVGDAGNPNAAFLGSSAGPYSSVSPMSSLNPDNRISPFNQAGVFRNSASPLKAQAGATGQAQPFASGAGSLPLSATSSNNGTSMFDWGLGGTNGGLGGAGWLGLGGGPGGFEGGGQGFSGDSAGGNEFTLLSEFLESLDGSAFGASINNQKASNLQPQGPNSAGLGGAPNTSRSGSRRNTISGRPANVAGEPSAPGARASLPPPSSCLDPAPSAREADKTMAQAASAARGQRPRGSSVSAAVKSEDGNAAGASSSNNAGPYPPSLGAASKTERFFLTAADQKDGSRDERLSRVIQAKYEAGLLRPYNHVNGYARLNRWMERNVSQASKRRILKPLSVFRPAFRAVAQSLTNIDLIFIEEAFERLLLDYDRVFSTQGIPACLWRRTGEIYKGNKEFAELVGVPIESLREGRLCIYELMAEESAVNYWEKYGAVSFDPGQKAVLTSCVLRTKNKSMLAGNKDKQSSTKLIAAQLPRVHGTTSSGQTTPTLAPQPGSAAGLFPLTPLDGGTRMAAEVPGKGGKEADRDDKRGEAAAASGVGDVALARTASSSGGGGGPGGNGNANGNGATGGNTTPGKEGGRIHHIHCCFSFTIRRDQWNIPTMIVGNFLPTNPP
ncbi:uncharacterized protein PFL1_00735 [Pseudozyma flocculosa PF-1]|uniref:uncharacterized protein n=1 Tax=Pseudozyma flocculosa PF-1 TaxID=1277687 RepID=UPI000456082E|nr:uncharacterized protein PFL1_00735 [Pseudozyma flocculosa PF-1]EPQ31400.1 hypothetical protein PFL1_00735 [Pseudozyma flocculosa PF-1]